MRVYVFRDTYSDATRVSHVKPETTEDGTFRLKSVKGQIILTMQESLFGQSFGFTVKPGKCIETEMGINQFGKEV